MQNDTGLEIATVFDPLGFAYGGDMFGPAPELRHLEAIRPSLRDPACEGPDPVYAIVMDVGRPRHKTEIQQRKLLFGVVAYAAGRLGLEPVRSQGHVHKRSRNSGWAAPEIFEIWQGHAVIYMQESDADDPGRCFAIHAGPGDRVITPPSWAHAVISADPAQPLVFGAWCDRDYGFVYDGVRAHGGLAWFPLLGDQGNIRWISNPRYAQRPLSERQARPYTEFGLDPSIPLYAHLEQKPEAIQWVSQPALVTSLWDNFEP